MDLQIINPITYPGWDDLLMSATDHSIFHTSPWAKLLKDSYGYEPKYFTIINRGTMEALIPVMEVKTYLTGKRAISLPFTDYCDPICNGNLELGDLLHQLIDFGKEHGWNYLELRGRNPLFPLSFPSCSFLGHILDLSKNKEELSSSLRDSTKRNIKKAEKEGVRVQIDRTPESVKEFYRLNCLTRKEHGLPPQPFGFFRKLHEHIISKGLGMVVLASIGQENIAGAVYLHFNKKAVYKYGASNKKYQHLRANNLVMWEAIRWYSENSCKTLCFGRTEPEHHGLLQFKSGWGATEQPIHYYRYDFKKDSFVAWESKVTGFHNKIFRNAPIPILKAIGSALYKHTG